MAQFMQGLVAYGADVVGTSTGTTAIFTAPNPMIIYGTQILLKASSALISVCTLSIGSNASSYNNINSLVALTGFSTVENVLNISSNSQTIRLQTGDTVYCKVTIAALATTYDLQVILLGYPM